MKLETMLALPLILWWCQAEAVESPSASAATQGFKEPQSATSTQSQQSLQTSAQPNLKEGETTAFEEQLRQTLSALVLSNDFDGLEKIADGFRTTKAQTADGTWYLLSFYRALCKLPDKATHHQWDERVAFLTKWSDSKRGSITARVALATCYKEYAWFERGYGYENTVNVGGWQLFSRNLEHAKQILSDARKLTAKCPIWWDTMQFVALGLEVPQSEYEKIFNEAVAFEPNYTFFYNKKVVYLLPRWYGREGDWQRFASDSADKLGGEGGDILYARIGWRVHQRRFYEGFVRDAGYSWPRMRKGLEAIARKSPQSISTLNELGYLACQAHDHASAQFAFTNLGNNMDSEVWNGDTTRFLRAKTWAMWQ